MKPPDPNASTVEAALRGAVSRFSGSETPLLDARVLMKFVLNIDDAVLIASSGRILSGAELSAYEALAARRAAGEPVAYITGEKEFWSLSFRVTPDVLIPRGDSECLIEAVMACRDASSVSTILDLGTGSGCLLCALLSEMPDAVGVGVDRSAAAARIAAANAAALGLADRASFLVGDWGASLNACFDIIVANPPYIAESADNGLAADVAAFEPSGALFAGADGMDAYRAILAGVREMLAEGGLLVFECGRDQAGALREMVSETLPFCDIEMIYDLGGRARGIAADCRFSEKRD